MDSLRSGNGGDGASAQLRNVVKTMHCDVVEKLRFQRLTCRLPVTCHVIHLAARFVAA
jgi:hypothetical protein